MTDERVATAELPDGVVTLLEGFPRESPEDVLWEIGRRPYTSQPCADWRNYLPLPIARAWGSLSVEARVVAYLMASERTGGEG